MTASIEGLKQDDNFNRGAEDRGLNLEGHDDGRALKSKPRVRRLNVDKEKMAGSAVLPAVETSPCLEFLPVSATVTSATVASASVTAATVETAAAGSTAVEATSATAGTTAAAVEATSASSGKAAVGIATTPVTSASVGAVTIAPASSAIAPASSAPAATPAPPVPGAGTDKHSATEPLRTVVAVGCAGIRSIIVVSVLTHRRPAHVARSHSDGNSYLRLREGKRHHQDCQQR